MKNKIFIFSCLLSSLLVGCINNETPSSTISQTKLGFDKELKLYFDPNEEVKNEISPYIYGTFIEHMSKIIYEGLWAEEIMDRKFVAPIAEDVSQWKKGTDKLIKSDNVQTYCGGYSAHFVKDASIYQRGIVLHDADYNGYLYAKGSGTINVKFSATSGESVEKNIDINSNNEFKKYDYSLNMPVEGKYSLTYTCSSGEFYMDSVSLMKADNVNGMRKDTLELLKELNSTFYRWPGGNFVSGYDFYDGIGPRDQRQTKRNLEYAGSLDDFASDADRYASDLVNIEHKGFYAVYEPNDFGIDEFIYLCRYLDVEPNIVLNSGLGSVEMARNEVEYINGTDGYYASLRPQKEPYNVKYFSIGNEMNGDWQLGHMPLSDYIVKHNAIANEIKKVSPNMKIIAVGHNAGDWTQKMIDGCKSNMDLTSEHFYAERDENSVKNHILSLKEQAEWRIKNHRNLKNADTITMAIDEYAYNQATSTSRLKDGMGVASCLNTFIKNSDVVEAACYSSTINAVQGQIITDDLNAYLEGSGMVNALYSKYMQDYPININYNLREFTDYIEVSATVDKNNKNMTVSIINTSDYKLKITNSNIKNILSRSYVVSDTFEGINNSERQELKIVKEDKSINKCVVEPRSVTLIQIEI